MRVSSGLRRVWSRNHILFKEILYVVISIIQITITSCIFLRIYYHALLYDPTVSGGSVKPTTQVRSSTMLALPIVGN
jgi:hypothetical protein